MIRLPLIAAGLLLAALAGGAEARPGFLRGGAGGAGEAPIGTWDSSDIATAPPLTATYAFARNITTGQNYFSKAPDTTTGSNLSASTVKITSGLVAVREMAASGIAMSDTVTVLANETAGGGLAGTSCSTLTDDVITYAGLLHGMALPSGNDCAETLARAIGTAMFTRTGSGNTGRVRFVEAMNALVSELGLTGTSYTTPHGVGEQPGGPDNQVNTTRARDLAKVTVKALSDADTQALTTPSLQAIFSTASYEIVITGANARSYTVDNLSPFLAPSPDVGAVSGKTGTLAGSSKALLYDYPNGHRFVFVVISAPNGPDRAFDIRGMVNAAAIHTPALAGTHTDPDFSKVLVLTGADPGFTDESTSAFTITSTDATRTTTNPIVGTHSYEFNGTSARLAIADSAAIEMGNSVFCGAFTFRGPGGSPAGIRDLVGKYRSDANERSWAIFFNTENRQLSFIVSTNGTTQNLAQAAFAGSSLYTLMNGAPHTVTFHRNAAGEVAVWVDGVKGATTATQTGALFDSTHPLLIGARSTGDAPTNFFAGTMDEIMIRKGDSECGGTATKIRALPRPWARS
jgi:D-alanyl-D-alanine carboxypeptidase